MEISQDEQIFTSIKTIEQSLKDDNIFIVKLINDNGLWSETEFNNYISSFRSNYAEIDKEQYLEIVGTNNVTLEITNLKNILNYCNTNNYKSGNYKWYKSTQIAEETVNNLLDVNIIMQVIKNEDAEETDKWETDLKRFRLIKEYNYQIEDDVIVIGRMIKDSVQSYQTMKKSKINNSSQMTYEFEIRSSKTKDILINILKLMQSIFLSKTILTKKQQEQILDEYQELVNIVPFGNQRSSDKTVYLLTPKPVALKLDNLENPNNYGVVSILRGYTVTEKADGERLLLYINGKGNVYTIDSSKRVEGTGLKAKKDAYNSLLDGEYIHCNKRIDGVKKNLYAAFDIYFLNGEKLTSLPLLEEKNKCRYNELLKLPKLLTATNNMEFIVKKHYYGPNIYNENKKILDFCILL